MRDQPLALPGFDGIVVGHDGTRRAHDYYATPRWAVDAVVPLLRHRIPPHHKRRRSIVIEPGSGHGSIASVLAAQADMCGRPLWDVVGFDIDPVRVEESNAAGITTLQWDWLDPKMARSIKARWPYETPSVVSNPPYALAEEFVTQALAVTRGIGIVAMLLRMSFLNSRRRAAFHREHPCDILPLDGRPSFTGGGTDSAEYGWHVWPPLGFARPGFPLRGRVWRIGDFNDRDFRWERGG